MFCRPNLAPKNSSTLLPIYSTILSGTVPYRTVRYRHGTVTYRTGTVPVRYGKIRYRYGTVPGTVMYRYRYRYCTVTVPVRYVIKENLEKWYGIRIIMYVKCASIVCPVTGFQNTCTNRK